jgi:hypothetical protein
MMDSPSPWISREILEAHHEQMGAILSGGVVELYDWPATEAVARFSLSKMGAIVGVDIFYPDIAQKHGYLLREIRIGSRTLYWRLKAKDGRILIANVPAPIPSSVSGYKGEKIILQNIWWRSPPRANAHYHLSSATAAG